MGEARRGLEVSSSEIVGEREVDASEAVGESSEDNRGERAAEEIDECWMVGRDDGDGGVDGSNEALGESNMDERREVGAEDGDAGEKEEVAAVDVAEGVGEGGGVL